MSSAVFPDLPGLSWGTTKEPMWTTQAKRSASGMEQRAGYMSYPLYRIKLSYEVLRAGAEAELQTLIGFFNLRGGDLESFLFLDPDDNAVTDQGFGTGDGSTRVFRLGRNFGGFYEPISATYGTPSVKKAGVTQTVGTHYTIDAQTGIITFTTAPASGAALQWSGSYYWRARFEKGSAEFRKFLEDLWDAKSIALLTVKT